MTHDADLKGLAVSPASADALAAAERGVDVVLRWRSVAREALDTAGPHDPSGAQAPCTRASVAWRMGRFDVATAAAQQAQQPPIMPQSGGMMGLHRSLVMRDHHARKIYIGIARHRQADALLHVLHGRVHCRAVDMARSELEHGKDPQLRQMAQKIIDDQERGIATFKERLA